MGERTLRPGIRSSERTASLVRDGGWMAQVFYDWLLTVVDDHGRFDARPSILRVEVFPLLLDKVREADVSRCLTDCEKAGLVRLYTVEGKPYLELLDFRQRQRAKKSKWPDPPRQCPDSVLTMSTGTNKAPPPMVSPPSTPSSFPPPRLIEAEVPKTSKGVEIPVPLRTPGFLAAWRRWEEHLRKKRVRTTDLADQEQLAKCVDWGPVESVRNIHHSIAGNYQGLFPPKVAAGRNGAMPPVPSPRKTVMHGEV